MSGGIYLIQNDEKLVELTEQSYDSEDLLQQLLAKYPSLLAGNQMDTAKPRRWLLVCREAAVPCEDGGSDRWSLDHLFLDQDAIPTLVEVKRRGDSRIRREVVGQMLDYAANAVVYWPVEEIRQRFEKRCEEEHKNAGEEITAFLKDEVAIEEFWQRLKTNLKAGRIRMVFVADEIPNELRRIVEFLNAQMDPAEVLAVEIRQFVGSGLKTLVPRVMGQTAEAERTKSAGGARGEQWTEEKFFAVLNEDHGKVAADVARKILDWSKQRFQRIDWGRGTQSGSFIPVYTLDNDWIPTFSVWSYGTVEIYFQYLKDRPAFDRNEKRLELLRKLNSIPGIQIPKNAITKRPNVRLEILNDTKSLKMFLDVFEWVIQEVCKSVDK